MLNQRSFKTIILKRGFMVRMCLRAGNGEDYLMFFEAIEISKLTGANVSWYVMV